MLLAIEKEKKMKKKLLCAVLASALILCAACKTNTNESAVSDASQASTAAQESSVSAESPVVTEDRAGNAITVPEEINHIVSLAPSTTQVLIELGLADKIVAVDTYSAGYADMLPAGIPQFDLMDPDCEAIIALDPDIIFTTGMSSVGGANPFTPLVEAGYCVADIPTSESLDAIRDDIKFIGACTGEYEGALELVDYMDSTLELAKDTCEGKTVLFLMSIPDASYPSVYTFGSNTYMQEMLDIIGATNVFADQEGWISVSSEDCVAADPDVILTTVNWVEDPVGDILAIEGWENVTAIVNGAVYYVDADLCSRPNEHIADAVVEWAECISSADSSSDSDEAA